MSHYFLVGGCLGFGLGFFVSLAANANVHTSLLNGMLGCLLLALLFQWMAHQILTLYCSYKFKRLTEKNEKGGSLE